MRITTEIHRSDLTKLAGATLGIGFILPLVLTVVATALTIFNKNPIPWYLWLMIALVSITSMYQIVMSVLIKSTSKLSIGKRTMEMQETGLLEESELGYSFYKWASFKGVRRHRGFVLISLSWFVHLLIRETDIGQEADIEELVTKLGKEIEESR